VDAIVEGYEDSQVDALRVAFAAVASLVVLGFWFTRKLPTERLGEEEETLAEGDALASGVPAG
jgi:hypothetical protein